MKSHRSKHPGKLLMVPSFCALALTQWACAPADPMVSKPSIQWGQETGAYPAIVQILTSYESSASYCTATFINPRTLITAAHCVYGGKKVSISQGPKGETTEIYLHPSYNDANGRHHQYDLAFVRFKQDISNQYYPLSWDAQDKGIGQSADMVGYGCDENGQSGTKREGFNRISEYRDGAIVSAGKKDGTQGSAVCPGDSGGPLLANGKVLGVASLLVWTDKDIWSYHTDLGSQTSQDFMASLGDIAKAAPARVESFDNAMIESKLFANDASEFKQYMDVCKEPSIINNPEWCRVQTYSKGDGGKPNQRFGMQRLDGDYVRLYERQDGKCLAIKGDFVVAEDCIGGAWNQEWLLSRVGNSEYHTLKNRHSGNCIDIPGARRELGTKLIQFACHGGDNQLWKFKFD